MRSRTSAGRASSSKPFGSQRSRIVDLGAELGGVRRAPVAGLLELPEGLLELLPVADELAASSERSAGPGSETPPPLARSLPCT